LFKTIIAEQKHKEGDTI